MVVPTWKYTRTTTSAAAASLFFGAWIHQPAESCLYTHHPVLLTPHPSTPAHPLISRPPPSSSRRPSPPASHLVVGPRADRRALSDLGLRRSTRANPLGPGPSEHHRRWVIPGLAPQGGLGYFILRPLPAFPSRVLLVATAHDQLLDPPPVLIALAPSVCRLVALAAPSSWPQPRDAEESAIGAGSRTKAMMRAAPRPSTVMTSH